jgi:hypothetical protein
MRDIGRAMEHLIDAMTTVSLDDTASLRLGMLLYDITIISE